MQTDKRKNLGPARCELALRPLMSMDARAFIALVSLLGVLAWLLPWQSLAVFLPLALVSAGAAYILHPGGRVAMRTYLVFVVFWSSSFFFMRMWETGGEAGQALAAFYGALIFGGRLFVILGLAALLPLKITPVTAGRVLTWYIQRVGLLLRGRARERVMDAAWKAGLALTVMASFLPRGFFSLRELSRTLKRRAPQLPLRRRLMLLGMASLRLLGSQTWDMSVSIAVRGLYRPEPWSWREPVRPE